MYGAIHVVPPFWCAGGPACAWAARLDSFSLSVAALSPGVAPALVLVAAFVAPQVGRLGEERGRLLQ